MANPAIPRGKARALGGERRPRPPYAVRMDISRYRAREIIRYVELNPNAHYAIKDLANELKEALAPWETPRV
jgi:translation initiation factor 1 (eIF-1/SUI1)